jgi:hypothetical protein
MVVAFLKNFSWLNVTGKWPRHDPAQVAEKIAVVTRATVRDWSRGDWIF